MSKLWMRLLLAAVVISGTSRVCIAQTGALPPLAPAVPQTNAQPAPVAAPAPTQAAAAPADAGVQTLYDGGAIGDNGVTVSNWGGGVISQDDTHSLVDGKHSVLIESLGFYQGGVISFAQPINLGDIGDKTKYIQLSVMMAADPKYSNAAPAPPAPTGPVQNTNFSLQQGSLFKLAQMNNGPMPPPDQGPGGGAPVAPLVPQYQAPPPLPANIMHIVFTFADGSHAETVRTLPTLDDPTTWFNIGIPISILPLSQATQQLLLSSITISTDCPTLINVGRIRFVTDNSPIVADAGGEKDIAVNELAIFKADATAGASMLKFQWDFDTQGPFAPEAEGPTATHTYAAAGVYKVTLVVTDVDGIKAPATATTTVHVED